MIAAVKKIRDKAIIMLLYSAGIRLLECATIKPVHIDSDRMKVRGDPARSAPACAKPTQISGSPHAVIPSAPDHRVISGGMGEPRNPSFLARASAAGRTGEGRECAVRSDPVARQQARDIGARSTEGPCPSPEGGPPGGHPPGPPRSVTPETYPCGQRAVSPSASGFHPVLQIGVPARIFYVPRDAASHSEMPPVLPSPCTREVSS